MRSGFSIILILALLVSILGSCTVNYSLSGASIAPEVKTISIQYFQNNASLVEPTLSQVLTDALMDKFTSEAPLTLATKGGDLLLEGEITRYFTQPVAIQGNETAAKNRLTITVDARFTNKYDPTMDYETTFTRFQEYPSSQNLTEVQDQLVQQIVTLLVQDIFDKAVVNW